VHKHSKILKSLSFSPSLIAFPALICLLIMMPQGVYGQQNISGLYQNYTAFQIYDDYDLVAGRNRVRVNFDRTFSFGGFKTEIDLIDRYAEGRTFELLPREIYLDWFTSDYDIRIGKQTVIWGQSTGGFVTDILTPVDLREFLTQDINDLRVGLTALNVQRFFGSSYLQLILSPAVQPDLLPDQDSRWYPVESPSSIIPFTFRSSNQQPTLSDVQAAVRFAWRPSISLDIDFMAFHWAHPMPAYAIRPQFLSFPGLPQIVLRENYRTSPMAGYSVNWQPGDRWSYSAEALYVNERLFTFLPVSVNRLEDALNDPAEAFLVLQEFDLRDDGYLLSKPWFHQMIGVQTEFRGANIGLQGYLEIILNYENRILPQQFFPYATAFVQRTFLRDRLQGIVTGRYNFFGNDYWVQLQSGYEIADGFEFKLGTNVFGGPSVSPFYGHLTFEQFKRNSFIFAQTTLYF